MGRPQYSRAVVALGVAAVLASPAAAFSKDDKVVVQGAF